MHRQANWLRSAALASAILAGCLFSVGHVRGEGPAGIPLPAVLTHPLLPQELVARVEAPMLDVDELLKEDVGRTLQGLPPRYAVPHEVKLTTANAGTWETLDRWHSVWRLRVRSPGAISLNFGFTAFSLPHDARLYVYSSDMRMLIRPFTAADNSAHGELWTPPVVGEEAVIELIVPDDVRDALVLTLGSINIGYREFALPSRFRVDDDGGLASGSCNVDVACPEAAGWEDEIASVGVISTGGSTFCTGFMVNNTSQDRTPYFITAGHCGVNAGNAASLVVFWNYQHSTCRPIGSAISGQPGDGTLSDFQTGSFFRAAYAPSDVTLVELDEDPDRSWGVTWAGWDRTGSNPASGACIHHPDTDEKRITLFDIAARPDRPAHGSSWPCSPFPGPGDNSHVKVYWSLGVTEPGSSGSPLFDEHHRAIGQLHGGASACGQTGDALSDCFGRFSLSWFGGGSPTSRLSDWLDPGQSGAMQIDTLGDGLSLTPAGTVTHIGVVGGPFAPASTQYTLSNATGFPADYSVSIVSGGTAPIMLNGGAEAISGSLADDDSLNFIVAPVGSIAAAMPAGVYSTTVLIEDHTNSIAYHQTHVLEIGQSGFMTQPEHDLSVAGPSGGPFGATQMYTLTSTRPTPVTVQISSSQPWITINGETGPVELLLTGNGAVANVTVGIASNAGTLPDGIFNATVMFQALDGTSSSDCTRTVTLEVGRYVYPASGLPLPITDFNTTVSTIDIDDVYCVGDIDVPIDIAHTFRGDLVVEIESPAGTVVRLHNRTGGSADNIITTYDDDGDGTLPDGPGTLSQFEGESVTGTWTLRVTDEAEVDVGSLNAWSLKIASQATCIQRIVIHDFPMEVNPGWTTQGDWAFGVPAGLGGDPTSGATGNKVYGYNLNGAYPNNLSPPKHLTTAAINMSGRTGSLLRFKRWLGVEGSIFDHARVQISTNGSTWTTIWENPTTAVQDTAWVNQEIDISAIADNKPNVYLRWSMGTTDGTFTYAGWNIDDVQLLAFAPVCAGNTNGDNVVNVADLLAVIAAWGACPSCGPTMCPADVAPIGSGDCQVNVSDLLLVISSWGSCP